MVLFSFFFSFLPFKCQANIWKLNHKVILTFYENSADFKHLAYIKWNSVFIFLLPASAVNLEGELFKDLMKGYNKNVRPMERSGDITQVDIKMTLTNLISLVTADLTRAKWASLGQKIMSRNMFPQNEKKEALTTSVWIELVLSGTSVEAALWSVSIHLWDTVKPKVFVGVAMVWLQAKMGPAAQVEPVWEHHKTTPDPLQDPLAARHHIGEQVSTK